MTSKKLIERRQTAVEFGKPRDEDPEYLAILPNSPATDKRSCTDIICCLIFCVCLLGAICCSLVGFVRGDPRRLIYPTDSVGRFCGLGSLKGRPYLFYFDLLRCARASASVSLGCPTPKVCLSQCPSTYFTYFGASLREKLSGYWDEDVNKTRSELICRDGVDPLNSEESIKSLVKTEKCAAYYVPSSPVVRRCIPSILTQLVDKAKDLDVDGDILQNAQGENMTAGKLDFAARQLARFSEWKNFVELALTDLVDVWEYMMVGLVLVMLFSMVWIFLLEILVHPIVYLSLLAFNGIFVVGSYFSFRQYYDTKDRNVTSDFGIPNPLISPSQQRYALEKTWLGLGCGLGTVAALFLLLSLFVLNHIRVAVGLIKEAAISIRRMFLLLFWPVVPFLMQSVLLCYWGLTIFYLASMGEKEFNSQNSKSQNSSGQNSTMKNFTDAIKDGDVKDILDNVPCDPDDSSEIGKACEFVKFGGHEYATRLQLFVLFMLFWTTNFVEALDQIVVAGAFSIHFWTMDKKSRSFQMVIFQSFYRTVRYHLGSLAFGSLVVAIVQMIRFLLEYVDRKIRMAENKVAKFLIKCLKWCMMCLESFIKFLNKNAYIMIAMFGKNFFISAKNAYMLIMRNVTQTVVVDKVVTFINVIAKLAITGAAGAAAYYVFEERVTIPYLEVQAPELNFSLLPIILLVIGAFLVATIFFSVLDMGVDTIFLCFLEDLERNHGTSEKPYYMSFHLLVLMRPGAKR